MLQIIHFKNRKKLNMRTLSLVLSVNHAQQNFANKATCVLNLNRQRMVYRLRCTA